MLIIPLYKKIDKVKERGLSLLATIDTHFIETKIIILKRVKHMISNSGSGDFDVTDFISVHGENVKKNDGKSQN